MSELQTLQQLTFATTSQQIVQLVLKEELRVLKRLFLRPCFSILRRFTITSELLGDNTCPEQKGKMTLLKFI